ncbi:MAG: hypothetical protein JMDDDDMK_00573 [Acidobacteria bacterium]|nr:hypothetical protein [Acidobacteriota bacterium]
MANRTKMTAFVLTLSLTTLMIAACERQSERFEQATPEPGGGITASPTVAITPMTTPTTGATTSPSANLSPFDQEFMMDAARGGMMEVQLGNLAEQKASSNEVKKFGQRIAADHSKTGQMLQQLASNLNVTLPQELKPEQQQQVSQLQNLSGKAFDRDFISVMLKDHGKDIAEYERAATQATNAELKHYASQVLPILREHMKLARNLASKLGVKPASAPSQ